MITLTIFIILIIFITIRINKRYGILHRIQLRVKNWMRLHLRKRENRWFRNFLRSKFNFIYLRITEKS